MQDLLREPGWNYTYSYTLDIEKHFEPTVATEWMKANWHKSLYVTATYLSLIYMGVEKMSQRPRWKLNKTLATWNIFMTIFSTVGAIRFLPELYFVLSTFGFRYSICNAGLLFSDKVTGLWSFLFSLSKILELFDTAFIVLRKQKLIFLHWYHHATVLVLTWYFYANLTSLGRWFGCMNYSVHSLMYFYYALRAMKFRVPRVIAMFITTIQLAQTVFGAYIIMYSGVAWFTNSECHVNGNVIGLALLLYLSNFILFARLFVDSYIQPKRKNAKSE